MTGLFTWANLLTAIRALLVLPTTYAVLQHAWLYGAIFFTIAVVTDIWDGKLARGLNQSSPFGGLFDHLTDASFVALTCWAFAQIDAINNYLWILILVAFAQYMLDSKALAGVALRMSAIGRSNGIAYFVLVGVLIGSYFLSWQWLQVIASYAAWVLVFTTLLSILDRLYSLLTRNPG